MWMNRDNTGQVIWKVIFVWIELIWILIQIWVSEIVNKRWFIVVICLSHPCSAFHLITFSLWHEDRATVRSQVMKLLSGALKKIYSTQKSFQRILLLYQSTSHMLLHSAVTTRSQQPSLQRMLLGCLNLQVYLYLYVWQVRLGCFSIKEASKKAKVMNLFIRKGTSLTSCDIDMFSQLSCVCLHLTQL